MTARQSPRHSKGSAARGASSLRCNHPKDHGAPSGRAPGDGGLLPSPSLPAHCSLRPSQTCMCPCVFSLNF